MKPATDGAPTLSVVSPVYRNAATLPELRRRVAETLDRAGIAHELLLVVDGCPEESLKAAETLAGQDGRTGILALPRNIGQNAAAMQGIRSSRGDRVVLIDADLQDPPEAIPLLLEKANEGYAAVFAGRRGRYQSGGRMITSRLFKWILHLITGLPRDAGMFVLFDRRMKRHLLELHAPQPFVVAMIGCSRLPVASIPVERDVRAGGWSAYGPWKRAATAASALWWAARWRCHPRYANSRPADGGSRGD